MTRETITGTLTVRRTRKKLGSLLAEVIADRLIEQGSTLKDSAYYKNPLAYIVDDTKLGASGHEFIWRFKRLPTGLDHTNHGQVITIEATIEPWANGLGAHLLRPKLISVNPVEPEASPSKG